MLTSRKATLLLTLTLKLIFDKPDGEASQGKVSSAVV